uniref:non-specific serine/threonine protein kinase n=1 Tax=Nicotiana sylvestris TaxID=4096 RepID=A0A1U7VXQ5_NICSY|nr:PREDICTED: probable LRR receptor-like serine/threonine-protein kinase At3g47570 [Nicotiana sylvestris]
MEKTNSILMFVLLHLFTASLAINPNDEAALLAFKSHISSSDPNNLLQSNWSVSSPVCSWIGITCSSRHHRVTALDISSMQLRGTIPPHLGNLSFLVSLDISNNSFRGDLPQELSLLLRLKLIDVTENNFSGPIPSVLSLLPNLRFLYLSSNKFSGEIPSSFSNLTNLQQLRVQRNSLQGKIPPEIGDLRYLTMLDLQGNRLTGFIPPSIFNMTSLRQLALIRNRLTGKLPVDICNNLPNLEVLFLSSNILDGLIPPNLEKCSKLKNLTLSGNQFTGTIPRELGNLTMLTVLHLGENLLEGEIPVEIGNLQNLQMLGLKANNLSGSIPANIFNISALKILTIYGNQISGSLPSDLGLRTLNLEEVYLGSNDLSGRLAPTISNASRLIIIDLANNKCTGPIPDSFGTLEFLEGLYLGGNNFINEPSSSELSFLTSLTNCRYLREVVIEENPLNGFLPASIGNFSDTLRIIIARRSKLKGTIPEEVGNLSGLRVLALSHNNLIGSIPEKLRTMQNLQEFYLENNSLRGTIPDDICRLQNLGALDLTSNQISGSVPACLGKVSTLRYLHLGFNRLNSTLPESLWSLQDLLELSASSNLLSGRIPPEIGNLKVVTLIDLSKNDLSGNIPSTIGGLEKLISLSMAHNKLEGPIPSSFGKMVGLEFLDFSYNNLTSEIPKSLEALSHLNYFNFSFNKLKGEIPTGGPFANFTGQSFMSNDALCGASRFNVSPCLIKSTKKSRRKRMLIGLFILLGIGSMFLVFVLGYMLLRWQKKKKNSGQTDESFVKGHDRISYHELQQATGGFSESNLLGKGSFSMVYKGILKDGTLLAAKVFNVHLEGAFKSFDTECEILRNLRHRNLTRVITSCSNPDFKALVLEYMPNGTLDKWLYSHNLFLDMLQRVDIMIDVASALDYLHNGYPTPVVHCDLKPSNVLLDQEMIGHVSDFGIAKLLGAGETFVQTRTIATIGYIAPEYGQDGIVSKNCDVYSFGIMMMETFIRMRPSDDMFTGDLSLRCWINDSFPSGVGQVVDANLLRPEEGHIEAKIQCLLSIMELALSCTLVSPDARVNMENALSSLRKIRFQFVTSCVRT